MFHDKSDEFVVATFADIKKELKSGHIDCIFKATYQWGLEALPVALGKLSRKENIGISGVKITTHIFRWLLQMKAKESVTGTKILGCDSCENVTFEQYPVLFQ